MKEQTQLKDSTTPTPQQHNKQHLAFADNRPVAAQTQAIQRAANKTGLPDNLKSGIENLSGYSMDDVKVHYNSPKPAQLQAHAYAQGTDIHIASGQERHLPHEAWHVVQQKQGRVKPTMQMKSTSTSHSAPVNVNDDAGLEKEADVMGAKALQMKLTSNHNLKSSTQRQTTFQLATDIKYGGLVAFPFRYGSEEDPTNVTSGNMVATRMKAHLDPTDVKTGSDTNSSTAFNTLFAALQSHTPTSWVRGHLLNHDLGGIAKPNNLYPITTAANGEHYHEVEKIVKHWVASKAEVDYAITAQKINGEPRNPSGSFRCVARVTKAPDGSSVTDAKLDKTINSIVHSGDHPKETFTRRYSKKTNKEVTKFASVIINDGESVLRDHYQGKFKKDERWNHRPGVVGDNEEQASNIDDDIAPSDTTKEQLVAQEVNPASDHEIIEEILKELDSEKINVENAFDLLIQHIEESITNDLTEAIESQGRGAEFSEQAIILLAETYTHIYIDYISQLLNEEEQD